MGIVGCLLFGYQVQVDVFQNIHESGHKLNVILEATFAVILACHVPYIFFVAKETLLVFIDEATNRSVSSLLDKRTAAMKFHSSQPPTQLAYKDMNIIKYNVITVSCFFMIITASIFLEDIGLVFTLCSAVSVSCLSFLFPGFFYLMASEKFEN